MKEIDIFNEYSKIKTPESLSNFMDKNIEYGFLSKNKKIYKYNDPDFNKDWYDNCILQTKEDLLKSLHGTCWDQVEFERSWFKENNYEIKTIYIMVLLEYQNPYPTHSYLIYKDKEKNTWNWFENSDFTNRGIHSFNTKEELIKYQYRTHVKLLKEFNIKDEEIENIIINEYDEPKKNISVKEYLDFVINSKKIDIE